MALAERTIGETSPWKKSRLQVIPGADPGSRQGYSQVWEFGEYSVRIEAAIGTVTVPAKYSRAGDRLLIDGEGRLEDSGEIVVSHGELVKLQMPNERNLLTGFISLKLKYGHDTEDIECVGGIEGSGG